MQGKRVQELRRLGRISTCTGSWILHGRNTAAQLAGLRRAREPWASRGCGCRACARDARTGRVRGERKVLVHVTAARRRDGRGKAKPCGHTSHVRALRVRVRVPWSRHGRDTVSPAPRRTGIPGPQRTGSTAKGKTAAWVPAGRTQHEGRYRDAWGGRRRPRQRVHRPWPAAGQGWKKGIGLERLTMGLD